MANFDNASQAHPLKIAAAILAGGQSRRMGRDKATLDFRGYAMIEHVLNSTLQAGLSTLIVGREKDNMPADFAVKYPTVQITPDDRPASGPVGGLTTALRAMADYDAVTLLPCDAPLISTNGLLWLCSLARSGSFGKDYQVIVPVYNGHSQPLFALYSQKLLDTAERLLSSTEGHSRQVALKHVIKKVSCRFVELPACYAHAVQDIDTPDQLQAAELNLPPCLDIKTV